MKKMFSMLVLALSLSLSVNAQHATVAPHVTVTPHVTVAPHVTATPHVSAPVHISEPAVHVSAPAHVSEPVAVSKPTTGKVTSVQETESSLVKPVTVIPHAVVHNVNDTTKGKADTTKATSGTEVKQLDPAPTSTTKDDSAMPWGFIGIIAIIVAVILFVTFRTDDDAAEASTAYVSPSEPEVNVTPADGSTSKEVTKEESSK